MRELAEVGASRSAQWRDARNATIDGRIQEGVDLEVISEATAGRQGNLRDVEAFVAFRGCPDWPAAGAGSGDDARGNVHTVFNVSPRA